MRYKQDVGAASLVDITGGGAQAGTYFLNLCNRGDDDVKVRVAITAAGQAPTLGDYVEYDATLKSKGALGRWPIALEANERVYVYASATGVSANLVGRAEA